MSSPLEVVRWEPELMIDFPVGARQMAALGAASAKAGADPELVELTDLNFGKLFLQLAFKEQRLIGPMFHFLGPFFTQNDLTALGQGGIEDDWPMNINAGIAGGGRNFGDILAT